MSFSVYRKKLEQEIEEFRVFAKNTQEGGFYLPQDIEDNIKRINDKIVHIREMLEEFQDVLSKMSGEGSSNGTNIVELFEKYGEPDQIEENISFLTDAMNTLSQLLDVLESQSVSKRNFDKNLCFSNIRWLLKQNPDVKIGQIEKEAGIRLGYMSRLEKEGNTSEPSIEFIVTAAKLLNVSIDVLVSINLSDLTGNERYILKVFEKLKTDTLADKLEWNVEKASYLNYMDTDINGNTDHPLFELRTFCEKSEIEYPNEVTRVVFDSKSFGTNTFINDDCFSLRLKNGTMLYLMSVSKNATNKEDKDMTAIEAWTYVPRNSRGPLLTSLDPISIAPIVSELYGIVKNQMSHLRINKSAIPAFNAFLKDDFEDDPIKDDDIPF